ncbi:tRNA-guanine transglycosylase [Ornatilinea apprima]|uniref:tRNA-guanine transglycosylase n=1 Tax=Ornatilinea apprima TaxID=1134406 RepID=A0A0N8GL46_9CHLR|nr:tRNA guanosine(34) transglycosylase Tgt [Ornatilinea apprima]KPL71482.1 tRNA-guanine transglycosylase [Ornatilinea apprima]
MSRFPSELNLAHGRLDFPVFLPDATFGVVRAVDASDLEDCRVQALVMNTFHLMQKPGSSTISALGGLHRMSGWPRPIITDSGGFQAYSLIRQNAQFGQLTDKGLFFQPEGSSRKYQLTPEKTVQLQMSYGADVVICLDDCTHAENDPAEQRKSVDRTVAWAKRCKSEYARLVEQKKLNEQDRPRIFAVVQGGGSRDLRRECAERLLEIGFDGYGYGGWPLDGQGNLLEDMLAWTRELIPAEYPMHALGIGHPENVLACYKMGYGMFDCAMPTRDARHGRLYVFNFPADGDQSGLNEKWFKYLYIHDEKHLKGDQPLSPYCDCLTCRRYSAGYLRHLFKMNDSLYMRLATVHNLRFMTQLTERIRAGEK